VPDALLVAAFADETTLVAAVRAARTRGLRIVDAYTAYPIEGLPDAMGLKRSRLPRVTLAGAVLGFGGAIAFEFYAAVFDWALDVGGKPMNSTLAFVPIGFEIGILTAAILTTLAFFVRSRVLPGMRPPQLDQTVTDDGFVLAVRVHASDPDGIHAREVLALCGAERIRRMETLG
jgi:hypothetical protein